MKLSYPEGATPLDKNELEGLIPNISLQKELNEFEKQSIKEACTWALRSRKLKKELLSVSGLSLLHKRMFDGVWKWAGTFRPTEKNIGRPPHLIQSELYALCENVSYQIKHNVYDFDERAVRFHHGLVSIHPFSNGNGRHARLSADLLLAYNGESTLFWGRSDLIREDEVRANYINALKKADKGNFKPLIEFARL